MTSERPDDESLDEFSPRDEIDAVFGYGHPNPERVGCPPEDVLALLARRKLPIEHPGTSTWAVVRRAIAQSRAFGHVTGPLGGGSA